MSVEKKNNTDCFHLRAFYLRIQKLEPWQGFYCVNINISLRLPLPYHAQFEMIHDMPPHRHIIYKMKSAAHKIWCARMKCAKIVTERATASTTICGAWRKIKLNSQVMFWHDANLWYEPNYKHKKRRTTTITTFRTTWNMIVINTFNV